MGNVFMSGRQIIYGDVQRFQVNTNWGHDSIVVDYPFFIDLGREVFQFISPVRLRRWLERSCTGDVYLEEGTRRISNHATKYFVRVYFEEESDLAWFVLKFGSYEDKDSQQPDV